MPREVIKEQRIFGITDIKLVEAGPRVLLIVEVPGLSKALQYETKLETSGGKDVIRLRLKPAEKEIKKEVTFASNIIGDIKVNDDPQQRAVEVVIELLARKVQYSVKKSENLVIVDILKLGVPN